MAFYTDSHGNIDIASPGLLKPGELAKRGLRLITDAEAKRLLAKGQPVRTPAEEPVFVDGTDDAQAEPETAEVLNAAANSQFAEVCAEIDACPNDANGKDRLEEIGREYDIELDKRKNTASLRSVLKKHIAETLGVG